MNLIDLATMTAIAVLLALIGWHLLLRAQEQRRIQSFQRTVDEIFDHSHPLIPSEQFPWPSRPSWKQQAGLSPSGLKPNASSGASPPETGTQLGIMDLASADSSCGQDGFRTSEWPSKRGRTLSPTPASPTASTSDLGGSPGHAGTPRPDHELEGEA